MWWNSVMCDSENAIIYRNKGWNVTCNWIVHVWWIIFNVVSCCDVECVEVVSVKLCEWGK